MKQTRRKFTGSFKAQVAIEALKERDSLSDLARRFEIQPNLILKWKKEFVDRSAEIFETRAPEEEYQVEKERLYSKIGQLEMEKDFLKKVSKKLGL